MSSAEFSVAWRWEGWTTLSEIAKAGAVDLDGNVVLVGAQGQETVYYESDDTFEESLAGDFACVRIDGDTGESLWTWTGSSLGSFADVFLAVDTDSNNDVIIGGHTHGEWDQVNPDGARHLAAVKIDGNTGDEVWRIQESAPDSATAQGNFESLGTGSVLGVAVGGDDNVFLVGQTYNSLVEGEGDAGDSDFFVMKLSSSDGGELWRMQGGESAEFDTFLGAKADAAGDLVAVGVSGMDKSAIDYFVVKFSGADGSILWDLSPATLLSIDVLHSVDVDAEGDVYVAGGTDAQNLRGLMAETPVVLKLSGSTGALIWSYEGTAASRAVFHSIAVDPATGRVVGAGATEGEWITGSARGDLDFAAVVLDPVSGDELSRYQDGTVYQDYLTFAGFDSAGELFLGGTWGEASQEDFVAIKLARLDDSSSSGPAPSPGPLLPGFTAPEAPTGDSEVSGLNEWELAGIAGAGAFVVGFVGLGLFCYRLQTKSISKVKVTQHPGT